MYKIVGASALTIIIVLGMYFNTRPQVAQAQLAPEFIGISHYINTIGNKPISLSQLHGYVVLIHFWRIGCPSCKDDIPMMNALYQQYRPYGLVVLSIHSPEFESEKDVDNVQQSVTQNNIQYPVLIDNTRQTWQEYGDQYWPRDTLVDATGHIVYTHIGTGGDYELKQHIGQALAQKHAS